MISKLFKRDATSMIAKSLSGINKLIEDLDNAVEAAYDEIYKERIRIEALREKLNAESAKSADIVANLILAKKEAVTAREFFLKALVKK